MMFWDDALPLRFLSTSLAKAGDNLVTAVTVTRNSGVIDQGDLLISVEVEVSPVHSYLQVHYSHVKLVAGLGALIEHCYWSFCWAVPPFVLYCWSSWQPQEDQQEVLELK